MLSPELEGIDLAEFMRQALAEARAAGDAGEVPIGAVVVVDGRVVGRGRARHLEYKNQIRHAELNALLDADECLWTHFHGASRIVAMSFCEPRSWTRVLSS